MIRRPLRGEGAGAPAGGHERGGGGLEGLAQRLLARAVGRFSWLPILAIVGAHIAFGKDDFPVVARAIFAVPAVLFLLEARAYLRDTARELPFVPLAMLQYYIAFGSPVFFELPFFDLSGPVLFSDEIRIQASLAVALGSLSLWGTARLAMRLGRNLPRQMKAIVPPEVVSSGWDQAVYVIAFLALAQTALRIFAPSVLRGPLAMVAGITVTIEFVMGLTIVRPPRRLGTTASLVTVWIGLAAGMFSGQIEPMARTVMSYVSGQWVATRRLSFRFIGVLVAGFLVFQPMKIAYRVDLGSSMRSGENVGLVGRLDALERAFTGQYIEPSTRSSSHEGSSVSRLSELSPLMHAMIVVPSRIDYAYGSTLAQILYAPIPRLIWPDKPTSRDEVGQRYAIIFGLQTEKGAETTAWGLTLLTEGYWNFGWFGIPFVCAAIGLLMGLQQRIYSGSHWALRAAGIAQMSTVLVDVAMVDVYGSIFHFAVARFLGVWLMYWLTLFLGNKARRAPVGGAPRAARG